VVDVAPSQTYKSASPLVGVAFRATMVEDKSRDARIVLSAVAPVPLHTHAVEDLLEGQAPSAALADKAARLAVADTQPLARNRAKAKIVKALVRQAILTG
jgi:CO/xanthine dehydrogenase FAD-binding subunit